MGFIWGYNLKIEVGGAHYQHIRYKKNLDMSNLDSGSGVEARQRSDGKGDASDTISLFDATRSARWTDVNESGSKRNK